MGFSIFARIGTLGPGFAKDIVLRGRQQLLPFGLGLFDRHAVENVIRRIRGFRVVFGKQRSDHILLRIVRAFADMRVANASRLVQNNDRRPGTHLKSVPVFAVVIGQNRVFDPSFLHRVRQFVIVLLLSGLGRFDPDYHQAFDTVFSVQIY